MIIVSFFIKDEVQNNQFMEPMDMRNLAQNIIKEEIQNQLSELSGDMLEDTEVRLDKLANQKIMAVGNYSEDVLKNIEDNHNEVMFLYNILNDKENTLKNTVRDIEAVKLSVKKMSEDRAQEEAEGRSQRQISESEKIEYGKRNEVQGNDRNEMSGEDHKMRPENDVKPEKTAEIEESKENEEEISESSNKERILLLYQQGKTNVEIAQQLNLGVGEVNLVLGLFK